MQNFSALVVYSPSTWWRNSELFQSWGSLLIPTCLPSQPLHEVGGNLLRQESWIVSVIFMRMLEISSAWLTFIVSGSLIGDIDCCTLGFFLSICLPQLLMKTELGLIDEILKNLTRQFHQSTGFLECCTFL